MLLYSGMDKEGIEEIFKVKTTEAAMPIIEKYNLKQKGYYDLLAQRASLRSQQHVFNALNCWHCHCNFKEVKS